MRRYSIITGLSVAAAILMVYVGCGFSPNMEAANEFKAAQKTFDYRYDVGRLP